MRHLRQLVTDKAGDLLTRDAAKLLLDRTNKTAPAVVEELVPNLMTLGEVQQVLRGLLVRGISIRNLPAILEILCDTAAFAETSDQRIAAVMKRIGESKAAAVRSPEPTHASY